MRIRRAWIVILLAALAALLVACDARGLPDNPTPQPTPGAQATPTLPDIALGVTRTPQPTVPRRTPTEEATSEPTAQADTTGTVTPGAIGALDREVLEIKEDAQKVRGLAPKKDLEVRFLTKEEMRANITKLFEEDVTREEMRQSAIELWLLRLLDSPTIDLYQLQVDLHSDVVLGYYDPEKDELYVLKQGDKISAVARGTIAHEYIHSVQDQHFDLEKLFPEDSVEFDRDMAGRALVEGDAMASEGQYIITYYTPDEIQDLIREETESAAGASDTLEKAPRYIRDTLYFPYIQSGPFIDALKSAGGFKRVDEALADPPQSTEQILHPEKYLQTPRDNPIKVTIPPLTSTLTTLDPGWKYIEGGSWGEFDIQLQLKVNGISDDIAEKAAAGWGGAWYDHYQAGEKDVVVLDTQWDTTGDAGEFNAALGQSFRGATKEGDLWVQGGRYFSITQSDKRVQYIAATDQKALEATLAELK